MSWLLNMHKARLQIFYTDYLSSVLTECPKIHTTVLPINRKWENGDLERLHNWLNCPPDSTSCTIRNVTLPPQAECICLSLSCVVHGNLHRAHECMTEAWVTVTLTLAGLQDNPVGGGMALHLPAGTQAGRLHRVCLKVGHAQKHYSETKARLGHAADNATVTPSPKSTRAKFEFKVPQPAVGNPPSYTKDSDFMTLKSSCRM